MVNLRQEADRSSHYTMLNAQFDSVLVWVLQALSYAELESSVKVTKALLAEGPNMSLAQIDAILACTHDRLAVHP